MFKLRKFFRIRGPRKPRKLILRHQGLHYDLKAIYDRVNADYFEGKLDIAITWVGNHHSRPRTRIVLGSYHLRQQVIRINRVLDQAHVPDFFVAYIVYHEMIHHVHPPTRIGRRRQIHHAEFYERERQFKEYAVAMEYRKQLKNNWFK